MVQVFSLSRFWIYTFYDYFFCSFLYRCTFERSLCQWKQLADDDFDWTRNQGSTGSYGTGPMFDHTFGSSAGNLWIVFGWFAKTGLKFYSSNTTVILISGPTIHQLFFSSNMLTNEALFWLCALLSRILLVLRSLLAASKRWQGSSGQWVYKQSTSRWYIMSSSLLLPHVWTGYWLFECVHSAV